MILFAVMMMAMAIPNEANAYDFSAVSPSGHTLYYNIVGNVVHVEAKIGRASCRERV